jgi:hypothetical protein
MIIFYFGAVGTYILRGCGLGATGCNSGVMRVALRAGARPQRSTHTGALPRRRRFFY